MKGELNLTKPRKFGLHNLKNHIKNNLLNRKGKKINKKGTPINERTAPIPSRSSYQHCNVEHERIYLALLLAIGWHCYTATRRNVITDH